LRNLSKLASELWKRRVVQFGVLYLGAAWVILQVAAQFEDTLELPNWVDKSALAILAIGLPIVLILAWVQESRTETETTSDGVGGASVSAGMDQDADLSEPLLAVLPFDNLSNDEEMQFFSDGVSEEILGRLARGSNLKVIGRASSFHFRGPEKPKAASALNASHILDGSIRRAGGRVRIAAHLVEATQQTTLWSDRFDRDLEDIFAVQDDISEAIADALHQTFNSLTTRAVDPSFYDLYLRASPRTYLPDDLRPKRDLLEGAMDRAPEFAAGWGRLAFLRSMLRTYEPYAGRAESGERIAAETGRALALDSQNVDALAAQYFAVPAFGDFIEADQTAMQLQQSPGFNETKLAVGFHLVCIGSAKAAAEYNQRLFDNDPLNLILAHRFASSKMTLGHYGEAIAILEDILTREPGLELAVTTIVRAHAFNEDWGAVDKLMDAGRPLPWFDSAEFVRTQRHPTVVKIDAWRRSLRDHFERTGCTDAARLVQAAHLGLVEEAYDVAETARFGPPGTDEDITDPDAYRTAILFHAGMPELRNDARFVELCAKLGLVKFWLATEKWPDCADQVPYDFKAECEKARDIPIQAFEL
jgi:TolB-like protein